MSSLHDLQQAIARAVITGQCEDAAGGIVADAPGAAARLAIYHNHYRVTLIDVLASTFPATLAAVGEDHFRAAARGFILTEPPSEPCLAAYGAGFPTFLAQLPPLAPWLWLADLARLEWAVHAAFHAPDVPSVSVSSSAAYNRALPADCRAVLHPSCSVLTFAYPVDRLRQTLLAGEAPDLTPTGEAFCRLLIFRAGEDVGWLLLSPPSFVFIARLADGGSLANATALAAAIDPSFDLAFHLSALINHGVVVDLLAPLA